MRKPSLRTTAVAGFAVLAFTVAAGTMAMAVGSDDIARPAPPVSQVFPTVEDSPTPDPSASTHSATAEPGDDNGGRLDRDQRHEPGDDRRVNGGASATAEPGDDNGGRLDRDLRHEPGDDRRVNGQGATTSSSDDSGRSGRDDSGRSGRDDSGRDDSGRSGRDDSGSSSDD